MKYVLKLILNILVIYNVIIYHTIPYHAIPYYTIPFNTIPYHTIPNITKLFHTIPRVRVRQFPCQEVIQSIALYPQASPAVRQSVEIRLNLQNRSKQRLIPYSITSASHFMQYCYTIILYQTIPYLSGNNRRGAHSKVMGDHCKSRSALKIVWCGIVLYCIVLYCIVLYCSMLHLTYWYKTAGLLQGACVAIVRELVEIPVTIDTMLYRTIDTIPCTQYHTYHTMHTIPCTQYHTYHTIP